MSLDLLLTCRDVTNRLTDYQDGALPPLARLRVRMHLFLCTGCQAFLKTFRLLPSWVQAGPTEADLERTSVILANVKARLKEPRVNRVPSALAGQLAAGGDPLLRLQSLTHLAFAEGRAPEAEPFLPPEVLSQLPPPPTWRWWTLGLRGTRAALLSASTDAKQQLLLLALPGGSRFPAHLHLGQESILVLHGGLDDGRGFAEPGEWRHYAAGHPDHAPVAAPEGCWALIRMDKGGIRLLGWRGWFQRWLE